MDTARQSLEITNDDEWSVIQPLIQKVLDAQQALGTTGASSAAASQSAYCAYYGSTYSCTAPASSGGAVYDRDDDLSISKGSLWPTSTKGGGLVQLIADTVTVNGQITSNDARLILSRVVGR